MKYLSIITITVCILLVVSCEPEKFGPVVKEDQIGNIDKLSGKWKITNVKQLDEEAPVKNSPYISRIITQDFPYTEFELELLSQSGVPSSFTTNPGNSPRVVPFAAGRWEVDNLEAPGQVFFINGTDTLKALFAAYPSAFDSRFILKVPRVNAESGKTTMVYEYYFTKQ